MGKTFQKKSSLPVSLILSSYALAGGMESISLHSLRSIVLADTCIIDFPLHFVLTISAAESWSVKQYRRLRCRGLSGEPITMYRQVVPSYTTRNFKADPKCQSINFCTRLSRKCNISNDIILNYIRCRWHAQRVWEREAYDVSVPPDLLAGEVLV